MTRQTRAKLSRPPKGDRERKGVNAPNRSAKRERTRARVRSTIARANRAVSARDTRPIPGWPLRDRGVAAGARNNPEPMWLWCTKRYLTSPLGVHLCTGSLGATREGVVVALCTARARYDSLVLQPIPRAGSGGRACAGAQRAHLHRGRHAVQGERCHGQHNLRDLGSPSAHSAPGAPPAQRKAGGHAQHTWVGVGVGGRGRGRVRGRGRGRGRGLGLGPGLGLYG